MIKKKPFTSLMLLVSSLIMTVTGIVLYIEPPGRVAYWTNWKFMGLDKTGWDQIHITSSVLFMIVVIYHLVLNWKVLTSYIHARAAQMPQRKPELAVSLTLGVLLIAGTIYGVPPFSTVVKISQSLKGQWVKGPEQEPPYGHAEKSTLRVLATRLNIDPKAALIALRERGVKVDSDEEPLEKIARLNKMTPMEVFSVMSYLIPTEGHSGQWTPQSVEDRFEGTGIGHKQIGWVLAEAGVDEAEGIMRLMMAGIEAMTDESIKEAAERNGVRPIEVLKTALIEDYEPRREQ